MTRSATVDAAAAARQDVRRRWLLSLPALIIICSAAAGPLMIVVVYSFLTPGDYGNVKWQFSTDAWVNVILQRDIFDDTPQWPTSLMVSAATWVSSSRSTLRT